MLSLKNINALAHYTDWIPAHVHIGTLGWNGLLTFGMLYWLVPKMWNTKLYSKKMATFHFWIATLGMVTWVVPMYWAGLTQALMWKEFTPLGVLQYPNFLETVLQIVPMYIIRSIGGSLYLTGVLIMVYNLIRTAKQGDFVANEEAEAPALEKDVNENKKSHRWIEKRPVQMAILSTVVILIGGLVEFIPTWLIKSNIPTIESVKPYTPLELEGRDLYIRESCNSCHSQMIRPFRSETERYGEYSKAGEFVYDHPFLWGSKRTGPDLHRVGGKYSNMWHYLHMQDPRQMSPGSIMPSYPWLIEQRLDTDVLVNKINAMRTLGVPYAEGYENQALSDLQVQAEKIADDLLDSGIIVEPDREIVALIAYLQRLGTDIKVKQTENK
jgi:cytochrome c oxidase cbb3-type subunit I/II